MMNNLTTETTKTAEEIVNDAQRRYGARVMAVMLHAQRGGRDQLCPVWRADQGFATAGERFDLRDYVGVAITISEPIVGMESRTVTPAAAA